MFPPLTVIAVRTIVRNGATYQPGDSLTVPHAEACSLIAQRFVISPGAELAPAQPRPWDTSWRDK